MTLIGALSSLGDDLPEALLKTILEKSPFGLGVVDRSFQIVWANDTLSAFYGIDPVAASSRIRVPDIVGEAAWTARRPLLEQALTGQETVDVTLVSPQYSRTAHKGPVHSSYFPIRSNDGVVGVLLVNVDHSSCVQSESKKIEQVSAEKHVQEQLAEQEKAELLAKIHEFAVAQAAFFRDVLSSVTDGKLRLCQIPEQLPARGIPAGDEVQLSELSGLRELRHSTKNAALHREFTADRWQDLMTAVSEAGMNAIVHGGGGSAQVCYCMPGCVQVWITDSGKGIDLEHLPRATLEKGYTTKGTLGHGMKLMLQTTDRVWLLTGTNGTTVVLEQDKEPIKREWM